jgi:DNA-directed RNA polymerase subunit RPC12/RpoP
MPMRHQAVIPPSSLPSLMMPCPDCSGRMVYSAKRPSSSSELEDTVYACRSCGAELIRTSVRQTPRRERATEAA